MIARVCLLKELPAARGGRRSSYGGDSKRYCRNRSSLRTPIPANFTAHFPRHSVSRSMRGYIESEFPSCDAERMYIFPNILRLDRVACPRLSPPSRRIESAVQSCPTDPRLEPSTLIGRQREESTGPYSATSLMIELTIQERPRSVPHCRLKLRISDLSGCKDLIRPFLEPQNP